MPNIRLTLRHSLLASVPVWSVMVCDALADCQPATPGTGQTVTCTGSQPNGFVAPTAVTGLTLNVQAGAVLGPNTVSTPANGQNEYDNVRVNAGSTVNNAGAITNATAAYRTDYGINLVGSNNTVNNTGTISLTMPTDTRTNGRIVGVVASVANQPAGTTFTNIVVNNAGTIDVTQNGAGSARGVYAGEAIGTFALNNSGLISATRGGGAPAATSAVAAVDSDDDTDAFTVTNAATGRLTATGTNTRAVNGRAEQYTINNSGTITATGTGSVAVWTFAATSADSTTVKAYNTTLTNTATGVINGDVRNTDSDLQTAAATNALRRTGTITNAGTINGNLFFGSGSQTVNNTGRIAGNITFLDVAGTVNAVNLGTGSSIGGNITARGAGTNTLNLSGTGTLTGTVAGFTNLNQTAGAWTTGTGSTQTLSGNLTVAGGTLVLAAGSTQTIGGLVQVTGSGAQLSVANTLAKTVNLSNSNTTLVNTGTITQTGAAGSANTAANRLYGVLANSTGADFANVNVVNAGTISVTQGGLALARSVYAGENIASMTVTNSGLISATRTAASTGTTVVAAIDSDDDVANLTVNNQAGGRLVAAGTGARALQGRAQTFTVNNAGTITSPSGSPAVAIYGTGNTVFTNAATGVINGDLRNTEADNQTAATTTAARRTGTIANAGTINGSLVFGSGSQTVTNTGRITGGVSFLDVAGTVNRLTLGTGSSIGGAITARGAGTNTLNLTGSGTLASTVTGFTNLTQADGSYTLAAGTTQTFSGSASVTGGTLTVNGRLNAATTVGAAGTLSGTGTIGGNLINNGTVFPGTAATPYGTLTVTGNYQQGAGGTLAANVDAAGDASRVAAGGTATVAGTAALVSTDGIYRPGTRYTLVTAAGGVSGGFDAVTTNSALPTLIRANAGTDANSAFVVLTQQSFGLVATTQNQRAAARGLDAALAGNVAALTVLDYLGDTTVAGILDRVAGQGYASLADPQMRSARAFGDAMIQRGYTAIFEPGATGFTLPPAVYAADMPQRAAPPPPRFVETSRGYGMWATGYGQFGTVNGTANAAGRTETIAGFAGGIDVHVGPGAVLGVSAGYGSVDVGLTRTGERAHTDNAQVGVYGGLTNGAAYGTLALGYAHADGTLTRPLGVGALQGTGTRGAVGGDQFLSAGEVGYRYAYRPDVNLVPFAGFQVTTFDQDRVTERSGGLFDLNVAARDFLSARALVGGRVEGAFAFEGRTLSIGVKAAFVHDFADVARTIQSSFALAPTVPFLVNGRRLDRDRALVGVGISTVLAPGLVGFVNYDAEIARSDDIQAVRGGLRYTF